MMKTMAAYFRPACIFGFALLCSALLLMVFELPASAQVAYPSSMASTGDSITRAFNTGSFPFIDAPANSWSTGTNTTVNSQYNRLLAKNSLIKGKNFNDAKTGAKMVDLAGQMSSAVSQGVQYVTVLMGANDVCTSSESTMTDITTFRNQFQSAMTSLTTGLPNVRVFVSSIPNIYNLWSILKGNSTARAVWSLYGICQSMLVNPQSTAQTDIDRRARVQQRNIDFNTQLAQVCALYTQCLFDNNATYNTAFVTSDVSTRDYFHPTIAGQAKLARVSWCASAFRDTTC
jgi:lysophospholipase L1-like esterase